MSDTEKITLTFKAGTGFDSPWVVIHGDSVDEASAILRDFRQRGGFASVRQAAEEFWQTPPRTVPEAVETVRQVMPGSEPASGFGDPYKGSQGFTPSSQDQQLPDQYSQQAERCPHGEMQYFANGRYGPFWACPLDRNNPAKCKTRSAR